MSIEGDLREHIFYVANAGAFLCEDRARLVDIAPGNGLFVESFIQAGADDVEIILCDAPEATRKRWKDDQRVSYHVTNKHEPTPPFMRTNLTLCVFGLTAAPIWKRQALFLSTYDHTEPGGGLIFVEEVQASSLIIDPIFQAGALSMSRNLTANNVPLTASWHVDLVRDAGFNQIDCFYRSFNVAAWLAIKDK